jgi:dienelactone hydrolase
MLESEYFAAAAYHAGGWRKPAEYKFADYAKRKIPIASYVGDKDEYFSVGSVQATENILKQHGIPAELHLLPGGIHAYSEVPEDFHDTVWNFLKANALIDLPKYAPYRFGAAPMK